MSEAPSTLITLLGGQPQVVTFLLDLLLARGENINRVVVVYLASNPRYQQAFRKLAGEFVADRYAGRECHLRGAPIHSRDGELDDIRNNHDVEIARQSIQRLLADLKAQGQTLHLGLSGSRRVLGFLLLSAATQYLTPHDCVWHIYTPPELTEQARDGAVMHAPPGMDVNLIQVHFVPWVSYFPGLEPLLKQSPQQAGESRHAWLDHTERARCAQVWDALSKRPRDVLAEFAKGHQRGEAAAQLNIALSTVDTHRKTIINECSKAWGLEEDVRFDTHFFREKFGPFLEGLKKV